MGTAGICRKLLVRILTGVATVLCLKAFDNVMEGKDIFGRDTHPERTKYNRYTQEIILGTDYYTVV